MSGHDEAAEAGGTTHVSANTGAVAKQRIQATNRPRARLFDGADLMSLYLSTAIFFALGSPIGVNCVAEEPNWRTVSGFLHLLDEVGRLVATAFATGPTGV